MSNDRDWFVDQCLQSGTPISGSAQGSSPVRRFRDLATSLATAPVLPSVWELMISKVMFKQMAGLVYPDGTVRELSPIARLLYQQLDSGTDESTSIHGFRQKVTGGIPLKQPPVGTHLRTFLAQTEQWKPFIDKVAAAPRTRQNVIAAVPTLGLLGRYLHRPNLEAQQVFELGLSIPHHFRLGREAQAIEDFETLLRLVSRAVESRASQKEA